LNPQGVPVVGTYLRSDLSEWLVTVGVEKAALQAPLTRSLWLLGAMALVLGGMSVVGAVVLGRRIIDSQRQVREAEARYRLLAENTNDMIVRADTSARRRYVSPAALELLGYTPEELVGRNRREHVHPDDAEGLNDRLTLLERGAVDQIRSVHRLRHKSGAWIWVESNYRLLRTSSGEPAEVISTTRDVSDRIRLEEQLREQATTDGLTGLSNRRSFEECLDREWRRTERTEQPLAIVLLDVDYFKKYNDTFGHHRGDECLRKIAEVLRDGRRASDVVARIGGEEFCLVLPEADWNGALAVAEAIRSKVEALRIEHPGNPHGVVTVSIGVAASRPRLIGSAIELLQAADKALYRAKALGRNCSVDARRTNAAPEPP
jgi:diguanylate cyclase (GGDEF)-like protein/PAS domain S-box-containing protein